jgi:hypothetical protein
MGNSGKLEEKATYHSVPSVPEFPIQQHLKLNASYS